MSLNPKRILSGFLPLDAIGGTHAHGKLDVLLRALSRILDFDQSCLLVSPEHGRAETQAGFTIRAFGKIDIKTPSHPPAFLPLQVSPVREASSQFPFLLAPRPPSAQAATILAANQAACAIATFLFFFRHGPLSSSTPTSPPPSRGRNF